MKIYIKLALFILILIGTDLCLETPNELPSSYVNYFSYLETASKSFLETHNKISQEFKIYLASNSKSRSQSSLRSFKAALSKVAQTLEEIKKFSKDLKKELITISVNSSKNSKELNMVNEENRKNGFYKIYDILINLNYPQIADENIDKVYNVLNTEQSATTRNSFLEKKMKMQLPLLSRGRLLSSNRVDKNKKANTEYEGEDFILLTLSKLMEFTNLPSCWIINGGVPFVNNYSCPPSFKYESFGLCVSKCEMNYTRRGLLCLENCDGGYHDCGLFCSKSPCNTVSQKDYIIKKTKALNVYNTNSPQVTCRNHFTHKVGSLCLSDCSRYGMINCGVDRCAATEEICKRKHPSFSLGFSTSLFNFVNYLYTIESNKRFGWNEEPQNVKSDLSKMMKYLKRFRNIWKSNVSFLYDIKKNVNLSRDYVELLTKNIISDFKFTPDVHHSSENKFREVIKKWLGNLKNFDDTLPNLNKLRIKQFKKDFSVCDSKRTEKRDQTKCIETAVQYLGYIASPHLIGLSAQLRFPKCVK